MDDKLILDDEQHHYLAEVLPMPTLSRLGIYAEWHQTEGLHLYETRRLEAYVLEQLEEAQVVEHRRALPTLDDDDPVEVEWVATMGVGGCTLRATASHKALALVRLLGLKQAVQNELEKQERMGIC